VILGVIDRRLSLVDAVEAPRVHWEDGVVYASRASTPTRWPPRATSCRRSRTSTCSSAARQAVRRDPATGELAGAGDPRRGGAVVMA
jgi:gamma-glutamyltranspeptidase/glutathione hydrolase